MSLNVKHFFYWCAGGIALIALAGPYPDLATGLVVLIIAGVLLAHYQDYLNMLGGVTPATVKGA
jgi:hypothetical protein